MLYLRKDRHERLAVMSISPSVLDIRGTVVSDQNVASDYVRFAAAPEGLEIVNAEKTFARNWKHPGEQIDEWRHKAMKCAEVLVPNEVSPAFFLKIYVSGTNGRSTVEELGLQLAIEENPDLFFV